MRKYILTLILISLSSVTAIGQQTVDNDSILTDLFAGWTDEQFESFVLPETGRFVKGVRSQRRAPASEATSPDKLCAYRNDGDVP